MKKVLILIALIGSVFRTLAADNFDGQYLTIPKVLVAQKNYDGVLIDLGVMYTNVVATVKSIKNISQGQAIKTYDTFDASTNQLQIPSVTYDGKTYNNVLIELGKVISVSEFPIAVVKGCGTPNWDYISTLGNFTMSTGLWGIRGQNTWVKWLPGDFTMCVQGTYLQQGVQALFEWSWPQEEYKDPNKPITKDFTSIHWTPGGQPMTPVGLSVCSVTLNHDLVHSGTGNNQTFYDLYASNRLTPIKSVTGSNNGNDFNFSIRLYSTTGYIPNDGITDKSALINDRTWIVRSQKNQFIQFMASKQDFMKGEI
jgi:hypothetical protein